MSIHDMDAHRIRWLIKTYNVEDLAEHGANLIATQSRIADE
ncbi:hypothetical protein [Burkholderia territorii]|nr:hypothetical protein [Burkholderia territorii]